MVDQIYEKSERLGMKVKISKPRDICEMTDIDKDSDHMMFSEFVECCKSGGFIDYDGFGRYATEDKESDIMISPSDITEGVYRKDFSHVIWYNK